MTRPFRTLLAVAVAGMLVVSGVRAQAADLSLVRDAEIEGILWAYTVPILRVAGIDPNAMSINLVADDSLNAFVAGGPNLFIHTGLLSRAESPEQIIGVIAHEVGHIAGAHGARARDFMGNLQITSLITTILGVAAAVASGQGQAAGGLTLGGAGLAANSFLAYSRVQESAADQAGLTYLETIGISAKGLRDFLKVLENEEYLAVGRQSPYFRTHPVTRERINLIENHLRQSRHTDAEVNERYRAWHEVMKAKLIGFLKPPAVALQKYPVEDTSVPARYARAIAHYRVPDLGKAVPEIDSLIAEHPDNPYFRELKGQMLFENGRIEEAVAPYREAVRLAPHSSLLRTQLAQVLLERNDPSLNGEALAHLKESARTDTHNGLTWRLLAVAYGRDGQIGMAALSLAEQGLLHGDKPLAVDQAQRAMNLLPKGSIDWLRAEQVLLEAEDLPDPEPQSRR